jgi:trk system potassium uptake protein TrkA
MNIVVLGAGHVGRALVEALHANHDVTVIDTDAERLSALSDRYDVRVVDGNGTSKRVLVDAGVRTADLLIACSSREDANIVAAILTKRLGSAQTIVRTSSTEYLEAWREREIDVDFMVSSELETANTVSTHVGVPAARQTDVFADGRVQIVEYDVPPHASDGAVIGRPLRDAATPKDSKVVSIIRGEQMILPNGGERILAGDRIVIIASPDSARLWSDVVGTHEEKVDDVVIFGAGRMGTTIARVLLNRGIRVRLVDGERQCALVAAEQVPRARVFHASAFDPEFLARERIGADTAAVYALNDDAKNLYAASLAKLQGVRMTIVLAHDRSAVGVYERAGIDVPIDPREVMAEEVVKFAHDPRIRQIAMLEHDRFEVLDMTVRVDSPLANTAFKDLPMTGSRIGAIIRNERALFPHSDEVLRPGDRVIIFVESRRAEYVESVL